MIRLMHVPIRILPVLVMLILQENVVASIDLGLDAKTGLFK